MSQAVCHLAYAHTCTHTHGSEGHTRRCAGGARSHPDAQKDGSRQPRLRQRELSGPIVALSYNCSFAKTHLCACARRQLACLCVQLLLLLARPPIISSFSPLINSSALANFFNLPSCHSPSSLPSERPNGVLMQLH